MKKWLVMLALVATPVFANTTLFTRYEAVRQALLKNSLKETRAAAQVLAGEATKAKNAELAKAATNVAKSANLDKAREAFGTVSDRMIEVRKTAQGAKPAVAYCPMVRKSWLQGKNENIGNPYDPNMKECGMFKKDE